MCRTTCVVGLVVAGVVHSSAAAAELVEGDGFTCLSTPDDRSHSESMLMFGALSASRSVRIVRSPRITRVEPTKWCPDLPSGLPPERFETAADERAAETQQEELCRLDGPSLEAGTLGLTVVETLQGVSATQIEVRIRPPTRVAFSMAFTPEQPNGTCTSGSLFESIDGKGYFSPLLFSLHPAREFLLVESVGDNEAVLLITVGLPAKPDRLKRALRGAMREQAKQRHREQP